MITTKKMQLTKGRLSLHIPFCISGELAEEAALLLTACTRGLVAASADSGAAAHQGIPMLISVDRCLAAEGYRLQITPAGVDIACRDRNGLRNAFVTLSQALQMDSGVYTLPCLEVEDWPDSPFRCMLIDMAREYIEPQRVKETLRRMAEAKMNKAIFHLMDSAHYALQSHRYPQLNRSSLLQYTPEEMRELVEYAAFWGIDAIPSLDFPAHATHLLDCMPELACRIEDGFQSSQWAVCVGNEELYPFIENLYQEVYTVFDSSFMMLCGDELEFLDIRTEDLWVNWEHCAVCRELCRREHIHGKREIFYSFIRRVHTILERMGKRMIMGNDNIDIASSPAIPRDILIFWWRVPAPGRGPWEGCSMERYLEEGFELLNCDYPECYIDLYMTDEKLADWNPLKRPFCPPAYEKQVLGSCLCAWEGKTHFSWTLPSGIQMFGDKLWDHRDLTYDAAYRRELTRRVLGPDTPEGLDVFTPLGGCLLPQDEDASRMGYPDHVSRDQLPLLEKTAAELKAYRAGGREEQLAEVYLRCLEWMRKQITNR